MTYGDKPPAFGDVKEVWYVLGKGDVRYVGDKAEPRSFKLKVTWVLHPDGIPDSAGWLPELAGKVPAEYRDANKWILQPGYGGVNSEQEAWSGYMRHVEHEMCATRDNANARIISMKRVSDLARAQWIKAQEALPLKGLIPPEARAREIVVK